MAQAYPTSTFFGFDYHTPSILTARKRAKEARLKNVTFAVAKSTNYPGKEYEFVTHFDCLHDMGDPVGAAKHMKKTLAQDGTWMIVEPFANDRVEDNLNPIGRVYYAASTMICVPASLASYGTDLGAQAGEARLRDVVMKGGLRRFRRAAQTPFNLVLEARP
jgi:hypothetical protein